MRRAAAWWLAVVLTATCGSIGALSASGPVSAADSGNVVFRVGVLQDVDNLNPFKGITAAAYEAWGLMYDTLTGYAAKDFSTEPRLAQSWEHTKDGLTWTYHLVHGVKFSDGVPLTAKDVAYTFNRVLHGKLEKTNYGSYVAQMKTITAPDDYTVVITLKKPTPIMLHLAIPILPEHIWSQIDDQELRQYTNEPDSDPPGGIGSGPFILTEAREGQYYTFTRNDDYWGGPAHINGIEFRYYRNADGMVQALKNGEIDFADNLDANIYKALEGTSGITTVDADYYGFDYLTFNGGAETVDGKSIGTGHPSLKDPRVRRAIHYAVDENALVQRTLDGRGTPGTTTIPPLYPWHAEPKNVITYNPDKANQILDDAGYARGPDGIRRMPDGSDPLVYHLYSRTNSETSQTTIKFLQGWLKAIGIDSTAQTVSESRLYEIAGEGTFDMYEWGWVVEPDPDYQLQTFTCGQFSYLDGSTIYAGLNDAFYCSKRYDRLYTAQSTEIDPVKREKIVKKLQLMSYNANAYIVTEYYDYLQAYRSDRFTGFVHQPEPNGAILFQYGLYSYMNIRPVGSGDSAVDAKAGPVVGGLAGTVVLLTLVGLATSRWRRRNEYDME